MENNPKPNVQPQAPVAKADVAKPSEQERVKKLLGEIVRAQIGSDRNHGWGQQDSLAVIDSIIAESLKEIAENKGATPEMSAAFERVINPSACRQWLESEKVGLLNPEAKREKTKKMFSDI